jgi:UPF0755 protein
MKRPKKTPPKAKKKRAAAAAPSEDAQNASSLFKWTLLAMIGMTITAAVMMLVVYPSSSGPGAGRAIEFDVTTTDPSALAEQLHDAGLVTNARYFALYLRLTGGTGSIIKGTHYLTNDASPRELAHRLERRGASHVKVVVPEGWTRFDIAKRLDSSHVCTARAFLVASESRTLLDELHVQGPSAEGYLFPATYDLELDSDAHDLVRQMVRLFDKRYAALEEKHESGLKDLSDSLGWGRREIVTLASMIEKEAAVDDERPVIASVFLNRLRDPSFTPKKLQCDPTAGYGCLVGNSPACATYNGKITHEINADPENAYSTYVHEGLPPGPIGNPGAKSLESVMSPALTHYFYFVAKGGGRHTFSETLGGHNAAVHDGGAPSQP